MTKLSELVREAFVTPGAVTNTDLAADILAAAERLELRVQDLEEELERMYDTYVSEG